MNDDAKVWRWYLFAFGVAAIPEDKLGADTDDRLLAAIALGSNHRALSEGFPLARPQLLSEVARLCREDDPHTPQGENDPDRDPNAAWLAGSKAGVVLGKRKMLDALSAWEARTAITASALLEWIAAQRKTVAP